MDYLIDKSKAGRSVLDVMRRDLGISGATVKHLKFKQGGITVNGKHVTVRHTLAEGEVLSLAFEDDATPEKLTPCDLELNIAYEDDDAVVPDKPADMPTHQSFGHYGDTVANALSYRYTSQGLPYVFRPVNRLDRNTSGLLLVARNRLSAAFLSEQMQSGRIRKKYIAILDGTLPQSSGIIDTYMCRTAESIIVRRVCGEDEGGDRAVTEYRVICTCGRYTMVCASPITGRTHQLRVHFAHLGAPIVGDDLYGKASEHIGRHALHSFMLEFPSRTGETIKVTAPLHEDMRSLAEYAFGEKLSEIDESIKELIF